jgi:hypothetical protein
MIAAVSGDHPAWRNAGFTVNQIQSSMTRYQCPICMLVRRKKSTYVNEVHDDDFDRKKSALN